MTNRKRISLLLSAGVVTIFLFGILFYFLNNLNTLNVNIGYNTESLGNIQEDLFVLRSLVNEDTKRVKMISNVSHELTSSYNIDISDSVSISETIYECYKLYGIPPSIQLGVMKVESGFSFDVISSADARGICQVLPVTAEICAKNLGYDFFQYSDLEDPVINIKIGMYYFHTLETYYKRNNYKNSMKSALSAYNYGPSGYQRNFSDGQYPSYTLDVLKTSLYFKKKLGVF